VPGRAVDDDIVQAFFNFRDHAILRRAEEFLREAGVEPE
jgi:hypothetical protein